MALKKCSTAVNQGGRRVEVGAILDTTNYIVAEYASSFTDIIASPTTYVQTYSTAAATVPAATVVAVATTGATITTPYGYVGAAQADAIPVAINALAADVLALKKVITQLIDDLQAAGLAL